MSRIPHNGKIPIVSYPTRGLATRDLRFAVKAIAGAIQSTNSTELKTLKDYLTSPENLLDTFKGNASSFRPWNNQLRQPILLTTHNWVVERAPIKGFLHQKNNLDTLGIDERNSKCKF